MASAEQHGGAWALEDLQVVVRAALAGEGATLTAGEAALARRLLALHGPPGWLYARLALRSGVEVTGVGSVPLFRVDRLDYDEVPEVGAALEALVGAELAWWVAGSAGWSVARVPELEEACRLAGLPVGGRRAELLARVAGRAGAPRVVALAGLGLLRRLELLALLDPWRDRRGALLERLGVTRWVDHPVTAAGRVFASREEVQVLLGPLPEEGPEVLAARLAAWPARPDWERRLDGRRRLAEALEGHARLAEREGRLAEAGTWLRALLGAGLPGAAGLVQRLALVEEAAGRPAQGAAVCATWRDRVGAAERLAVERTGRRLARKARVGWAPSPPPRRPRVRTLHLPLAPVRRGDRPLWGDPPTTVEAAVVRVLRPREALHAENGLWTTIFGLVLFDLLWLPVPGMLPTPRLTGPRDLGTAAFAAHRREALERALAEVAAGGGPARLERHLEHLGSRVTGVRPTWSPGVLRAVLAGVGAPGLAAVLRRLAEEGFEATRGLPDLVVLPGEPVTLAASHPARLGPGLLLAEVKGPGDAVRDAQAAWHHALLEAGVPVEVWEVRSAG